MQKTTEDVFMFVQEILRGFSEPYGEDITEDVFLAIENNPNWYRQYEALSATHSRTTVNKSIGRYTKEITGLQTLRSRCYPQRSKLITFYSKLTPR